MRERPVRCWAHAHAPILDCPLAFRELRGAIRLHRGLVLRPLLRSSFAGASPAASSFDVAIPSVAWALIWPSRALALRDALSIPIQQIGIGRRGRSHVLGGLRRGSVRRGSTTYYCAAARVTIARIPVAPPGAFMSDRSSPLLVPRTGDHVVGAVYSWIVNTRGFPNISADVNAAQLVADVSDEWCACRARARGTRQHRLVARLGCRTVGGDRVVCRWRTGPPRSRPMPSSLPHPSRAPPPRSPTRAPAPESVGVHFWFPRAPPTSGDIPARDLSSDSPVIRIIRRPRPPRSMQQCASHSVHWR